MVTKNHRIDLIVDGKVTQTGTPSAGGDLVTKTYADATYTGGGSPATVAPLGLQPRWDPATAFVRPANDDYPTITVANSQEHNVSAISGTPDGYLPYRAGGVSTADLDMPNDPNFRYLGLGGVTGTPIPSYTDKYVELPLKPGGDAQFARWFWQIEFETDALEVDLRLKDNDNSGNLFALKINNRYYGETCYPVDTIGTNSRYGIKLTFPTAKMRRIQFIAPGDVGWGGIWVTANATVRKPVTPINRTIAFIGDSITNGSNVAPDGAFGILETYAPRLGHLLDGDELILLGVGGTGWVDSTAEMFGGDRLTAALAMNPDILFFVGSVNDGGAVGSVTAAVTAGLALCTAVPEVYVVGTHYASNTTLNAAILAGAVAGGRPYIDCGILVSSDTVNVRADTIHPTFLGHKKITQRIWQMLNGIDLNRLTPPVTTARTLTTTAPLTGGGDLSANRTLAVSAATETAVGVVELATVAEAITGTDTTRAITAAGGAAQFIGQKSVLVRVASNSQATLATAYANGQTLDGIVLATGDVILLAMQTSTIENGVYTVNASGAPTRHADFDASGDLVTGTMVRPTRGSAWAGTVFVCLTVGANPWVPGTNTSTWVRLFHTNNGYGTGGGDVTVADGGTGRSTSTTAYGLLAAGTTATGAHQTLAAGTAGQILKSGGAAALPAFATGAPADVALGNVNNTSDAAKPISTATQTALDAKADAATTTTALDAKVASTTIDDIWTGNQAAYDAIGSPAATTLYIVV